MRKADLPVIITAAYLVTTAHEQGHLTEIVQKYLESDDTGTKRAVCEVILELLEEGDEETQTQRRVSHASFLGGSIAHCSCPFDRHSYWKIVPLLTYHSSFLCQARPLGQYTV